jgi:hypothetical protein
LYPGISTDDLIKNVDGAIIKKNVQRVITDPEIDAALVPVIENQKDLTVVYEELVESPENFEEVCQVREIPS